MLREENPLTIHLTLEIKSNKTLTKQTIVARTDPVVKLVGGAAYKSKQLARKNRGITGRRFMLLDPIQVRIMVGVEGG